MYPASGTCDSGSKSTSFVDVGSPPPDYEEEVSEEPVNIPEDPIIVLIVGETQQGKSTLIRQIGRYAGVTDIQIGIGGGNKSCTRTVGEFSFSIPFKKYTLVDNEGHTIQDKNFADLCKLTADDAVAKADQLEDGRSTAFTFIDTPGLNDTDGDDLDIMAGIISRVSDLHHLNAIIYVRSVEESFSESFRRFFSYIQRSMPSISAGILIAHTRCSTEKTLRHLNDDASFSNLRRQAFKEATHLETAHFFMDNLPDPDEPFAVVQSMNEIFRLLLFCRSQKAVDTGNLHLLKTTKMTHMDPHIIAALSSLRGKLDSKWHTEVANERSTRQELHRKLRDIGNKRDLLKKYQADINAIRTETTILIGNKDIDYDWTFLDHFIKGTWKLKPLDINFSGPYTINEVKKTAGSGCKWQDEHQQGAIWKGTLKANRLTNLVGSATFYTTGPLKYHDKLIHLERESARLEGQLDLLGQGFEPGQLQDEEANPAITELERQVKECESLMAEINKETFSMNLYPRLKHIYLLNKRPSGDDIFMFIQAYNHELADMYWREQSSWS